MQAEIMDPRCDVLFSTHLTLTRKPLCPTYIVMPVSTLSHDSLCLQEINFTEVPLPASHICHPVSHSSPTGNHSQLNHYNQSPSNPTQPISTTIELPPSYHKHEGRCSRDDRIHCFRHQPSWRGSRQLSTRRTSMLHLQRRVRGHPVAARRDSASPNCAQLWPRHGNAMPCALGSLFVFQQPLSPLSGKALCRA